MDRGSWHCTGGSDQDHSQDKEMQQGKMVVWGGLTNSWEKRIGKGEKERYTHVNAEFQRIARRDKKTFLRAQSKEIEENSKMGKTRDLKKLEIPREHFMQRWAQQRTVMVWTEQKQKILRRDGKNTQNNHTKKIFKTQITRMVRSLTQSQISWNVKSSGP